LQVVGPELTQQSDATALLTEVDDDPLLLLSDLPAGGIELFPAVATERPKHVPRKTLRVNANENVVVVLDTPTDQRQMVLVVFGVLV
jgi:hypothetical protein